MGLLFEKGWGGPKKTESAGTVINLLIPGKPGLYTYLTYMGYTDAGTAHTLGILRSTGETTASAALAAAGTSLVLKADPGPSGNGIAASDYIAIELDDGSWHLSLVTSWTSGTLTAVLTTAIPTGRSVEAGAKVAFFGVIGDSDHDNSKVTGGTGSAITNFPAVANQGVLAVSRTVNDPILLQSNNASNAGTFTAVCAAYGR